MWQYTYQNELYHYGVKGMKWGVRRYQNNDGSLTSAGKKRYTNEEKKIQKYRKKLNSALRKGNNVKSLKYSKKLDEIFQKNGTYDKIRKDIEAEEKRLEPARQRIKPSKWVNSKTPYFAMDEKQRSQVDNYYKGRLAVAKKKINDAKTESEKRDRMDDYTVIESEMMSIYERDW